MKCRHDVSEDCPACMQEEIDRLRANHKDVVETKRGTGARLKVALDGLQQIYTVCGDNASKSCDHEKALAFVRQVAGHAFVAALLEAEDASTPSPSDQNSQTVHRGT